MVVDPILGRFSRASSTGAKMAAEKAYQSMNLGVNARQAKARILVSMAHRR
jgi:hypothetical protein